MLNGLTESITGKIELVANYCQMIITLQTQPCRCEQLPSNIGKYSSYQSATVLRLGLRAARCVWEK